MSNNNQFHEISPNPKVSDLPWHEHAPVGCNRVSCFVPDINQLFLTFLFCEIEKSMEVMVYETIRGKRNKRFEDMEIYQNNF